LNKHDFIRILREKLQNLPETERETAIEYYDEYFAEAGVQNEDKVIRELGDPAVIAKNLMNEFYSRDSSFTQSNQSQNQQTTVNVNMAKKDTSVGWTIFIIIMCVIFGIPAVATITGAIVSIVSFIASLIITFFAVGISFIISGIILFVYGIIRMITDPIIGMFILGVALFMTGIGILSLILTWIICVHLLVPFCKWCVKKIKGLFNKNKEGRIEA